MRVDIGKPQKIVPSSPLLTVRSYRLQVDCRHQPSFLRVVVFLHGTGAAAALFVDALE